MTNEEAIIELKCAHDLALFDASTGEISTRLGDVRAAEAFALAIKALEQTRWIPVTECLPEDDGEYFVTWITSRSKRPLLEIYEYSCGEWNIDNGGAYPDAEIIAWMSLPKCYMAESEDNT